MELNQLIHQPLVLYNVVFHRFESPDKCLALPDCRFKIYHDLLPADHDFILNGSIQKVALLNYCKTKQYLLFSVDYFS